ncbi:MAG: hypothetical protein AB1486_16930 [Planctomycetota bacterium]
MEDPPVEPIASLVRAWAIASRAAGLDPRALFLETPGASLKAVRSACLDEELVAELRGGPELNRDGDLESNHGLCQEFGRYVGSYGNPELEEVLEEAVWARALAAGIDGESVTRVYRQGLEASRQELRGFRPEWRPDRETRLGAFFEQVGRPLQPIGVMRGEVTDGALVHWDFRHAPPVAAGAAREVVGRCVALQGDFLQTGHHYLWLGVPGVSEVRLTFEVSSTILRHPTLALRLQKASREPVPFRGTGRVDLLLDGRLVIDSLSVLDESPRELVYPLRWQLDQGVHTVLVRLDDSSNTTLRLHYATVRLD